MLSKYIYYLFEGEREAGEEDEVVKCGRHDRDASYS